MIATELAIVCFKGQTMSGEGAVSYLYYLNEIQRMTTVVELKQKVLELALQIASRRGGPKTSQRQLAEDALQYMQEHFSEESMSLKELADQFHVSQTYMSIVLKQETERNFSTHLLNLRMEKAMELLRRSNVRHYTAAEQEGYRNSQYIVSGIDYTIYEIWTRDGNIMFDNRRAGHDGTISSDKTQVIAAQAHTDQVPYFGFARNDGQVYKKIEMPFYCNVPIAILPLAGMESRFFMRRIRMSSTVIYFWWMCLIQNNYDQLIDNF